MRACAIHSVLRREAKWARCLASGTRPSGSQEQKQSQNQRSSPIQFSIQEFAVGKKARAAAVVWGVPIGAAPATANLIRAHRRSHQAGVERDAAGMEASRVQNKQATQSALGTLTLEDSVAERSITTGNGGRAAQPADLRLYARLAACELQPQRDVEPGPAR